MGDDGSGVHYDISSQVQTPSRMQPGRYQKDIKLRKRPGAATARLKEREKCSHLSGQDTLA